MFPSISNLMMKWAFPIVIKVFCQKTENQGLNGFLSALRYIVEFYVCHSLLSLIYWEICFKCDCLLCFTVYYKCYILLHAWCSYGLELAEWMNYK